ncbi:MAG: glutamate racemase [Oscillospiraceae bacterium]
MGPIAVFDSGVGGLSVLRELVAQMPSEHFLYFGDSANAPYGTRPTAEIRSLTLAHAERLFDRGAKALSWPATRRHPPPSASCARWPDRVIIGIEPALSWPFRAIPAAASACWPRRPALREEKFAALLALRRELPYFEMPLSGAGGVRRAR